MSAVGDLWVVERSVDVAMEPRAGRRLPGFTTSALARGLGFAVLDAFDVLLPGDSRESVAIITVTHGWDDDFALALERRVEEQERISPLNLAEYVPNGVLGRCAQLLGVHGPLLAVSNAAAEPTELTELAEGMLSATPTTVAIAVVLSGGLARGHLLHRTPGSGA